MRIGFNPQNNYKQNFTALDIPVITKNLKEADKFARLIDEGKILKADDISDLQKAISKADGEGKKGVAFRLRELLEIFQPT